MAAQQQATKSQIRRLAEFVAGHNEPVCRRDIIDGLKLREVSPSSVTRWLNEAVDDGLLERTGISKGSAYMAVPSLRMELMRRGVRQDVSTRPRVGYVPEFLASYEPNKTPYLSKDQLERLMARCPPGSTPMAKFNAHELSMFMNDISHASSRLEGNQYGLADTMALLEHDIVNVNLPPRDKTVILNHREACRYLIDGVRGSLQRRAPQFTLTPMLIRNVHTLLSNQLLKNPSECGTIRNRPVEINYSSYMPLAWSVQIETEFDSICSKAAKIRNPYEQAFFLLVHLPYLQPFVDCNKRTARIACNLPLLRGGITPLSWVDTNEVDYKDACLVIYEYNDVSLLAEVFVNSFMRAAERFTDMQRQREPDPISIKYRPEIKETIRARVLEAREVFSPKVNRNDLTAFIEYVDTELAQMRLNTMLGVRYQLTPATIEKWSQSVEEEEEEATAESQRAMRDRG